MSRSATCANPSQPCRPLRIGLLQTEHGLDALLQALGIGTATCLAAVEALGRIADKRAIEPCASVGRCG